jgi:Ni/Co efflux regulator RcnB
MANYRKITLLLISLSLIGTGTVALAEPPAHAKGAQKAGKKAEKAAAKHLSDSNATVAAASTGIVASTTIGGITINAGINAGQAREMAVSYQQTGYSSLPPGIRKNLARGKPLPPGIAKKLQSSPMLRQLPQHPGYEWQACGTDLVLVSIASQVIAEVLIDVFN